MPRFTHAVGTYTLPVKTETDMPNLDFWAAYIVPDAVFDPVIASLGKAPAVLAGIVTGHPRLADGKLIVTSIVKWIDVERGEARTFNTLYKLQTALPIEIDYQIDRSALRLLPEEFASYRMTEQE